MPKKKKKNTKKAQNKRVARIVVISAAVFVIGFGVSALLWGTKQQHEPVIKILPEEPTFAAREGSGDIGSTTAREERVVPEEERGNILIIIDDVGYNMHQLEPFLKFPGPIVFAILPGVPYSRQAAERINAAGKTCIIHQPMQAVSVQNLGENPILQDMDTENVRSVLEKSIDEVPYAVGMNNHMGSLITSDPEKMEIIMSFLDEQGLVFIDSLTTSKSAVKKTAEKLKLPYLHRHVFLDNEKTREYYTDAFHTGVKKAGEEGLAVLIGHVWADGLAEILTELYLQAEEEGVNFITFNELEETVIRYAGIGD